jgi:hypothetical protein
VGRGGDPLDDVSCEEGWREELEEQLRALGCFPACPGSFFSAGCRAGRRKQCLGKEAARMLALHPFRPLCKLATRFCPEAMC